MLKIKSSCGGKVYGLSEEVYRINDKLNENYTNGTLVRLISGIAGVDNVGYHHQRDFYTICRLDSPCAEFEAIERLYVRQIAKNYIVFVSSEQFYYAEKLEEALKLQSLYGGSLYSLLK